MIQLLFVLLSAEVAVVLLLLIKTPFRKLVVLGLDRLKRGMGPVMVRTIAATFSIVLCSSLYSVRKIQERSGEGGILTPTDQVLLSGHLLEASLMGYSLFLSLIVDRLHHYVREIRGMKKNVEAVTKNNRTLEEGKAVASEELKLKDREVERLSAKIAQVESAVKAKTADVEASEASAFAMQKQSEGFLLEYNRLLEENQNLRNQLKMIDRKLSHSDGKKVS